LQTHHLPPDQYESRDQGGQTILNAHLQKGARAMNRKKILNKLLVIVLVLIVSVCAVKAFSLVKRVDATPYIGKAADIQTAERIIYIDGEVNSEMLDNVCETLNDLTQAGSPDIEVIISSSGGYVEPGLDIIDQLGRYRGKKTAKVTRTAGSMAAIILQACDRRLCADNATIFVHNLYMENVGLDELHDQRQLKKLVKELEEDQEKMNRLVMKRTGMSRQKVVKIFKKKPTFSAKEALELGLIDQII